ncbi:MAG: class I SAM-dependent methyltransferase [Betaproteobacteria bacterium]|nr:MAG: class I SAM-dependent methyltransferase [Betaproteobacteria bacterium]
MTDTRPVYEAVARQFDRDRSKSLMEKFYLDRVLALLGGGKKILDLGCGSAEPIAKFFIDAGRGITGVDAATAMIALCRERYPEQTWIEGDMRALDLGRRFNAIIAWDSFFHLPAAGQRAMFPVFARHAAPGAPLLFTSGPRAGVAMGEIYGHALHHASLDTAEYGQLLAAHGFEVLLHRVEDPDCGRHTVWLAQARRRAAARATARAAPSVCATTTRG